jgi:hypothetical protein
MPHYVLAVTSAAAQGRDDDYNDWYDTYHFKEMLEIPGIVGGRRLQVSPMSPHQPPARYLAEYDIEADDPATVMAEMNRRVQGGEMRMTDSLDVSQVQIWVYERRSAS